MQRFLAQRVECNGQIYPLSIVTVDNNNDVLLSIEPFVEETESTIFVNGTLIITADADNRIRSISEQTLE